MAHLPFVDKDKLEGFFLNELGGDSTILKELLKIFKEQFDELKLLSPTSNNLKKLAALAHKIRSGANTLSALKLSQNLKKLEQFSDEDNAELAKEIYFNVINDYSESLGIIEGLVEQLTKDVVKVDE